MKFIFVCSGGKTEKHSVLDKNNAVKHKVIGFPHLSYIYFEITMAHYFTVYNFLIFFYLKKIFYLFLERGEGRE